MQTIRTTTEIGQLVRAARKTQKLRQPDLAGVSGTSIRFIVELERGKPTAQIGKVLRVLQMLGIRVSLDLGED